MTAGQLEWAPSYPINPFAMMTHSSNGYASCLTSTTLLYFQCMVRDTHKTINTLKQTPSVTSWCHKSYTSLLYMLAYILRGVLFKILKAFVECTREPLRQLHFSVRWWRESQPWNVKYKVEISYSNHYTLLRLCMWVYMQVRFAQIYFARFFRSRGAKTLLRYRNAWAPKLNWTIWRLLNPKVETPTNPNWKCQLRDVISPLLRHTHIPITQCCFSRLDQIYISKWW